MSDEEMGAVAAWVRRYQGIDLDAADLREPAGASAKLCALVREAARRLPFGAEPPDFDRALGALRQEEPGDAR